MKIEAYKCPHCQEIVSVGEYKEHIIFHNKTSEIQYPDTFEEMLERFCAVGLISSEDLFYTNNENI